MFAPAALTHAAIASSRSSHSIAQGPAIMRQIAAADLHAAHVDDARLGVGFVAGQLIGWQHGNHVGHAGDRPQRSVLQLGFVADDADDRAIGAAAQMGLQAERFHPLDDVVDLRRRWRRI